MTTTETKLFDLTLSKKKRNSFYFHFTNQETYSLITHKNSEQLFLSNITGNKIRISILATKLPYALVVH